MKLKKKNLSLLWGTISLSYSSHHELEENNQFYRQQFHLHTNNQGKEMRSNQIKSEQKRRLICSWLVLRSIICWKDTGESCSVIKNNCLIKG